MAVVNVPGKPVEEIPRLLLPKKQFDGAVIDTHAEQFNTLSTFHSGSRVRVDYYSRVSGDDTAPASIDPNLPAVYGSYTLIKGLEIRLTDDVKHNQSNDPHRGFDSNASAIFPGIVTPQEGEFMVMDFGQGQAIVATIVSLTGRGSPYTESATRAEIRITKKMTPEYQRILESKVVDTLYWDQDLLRNGLSPLLREEEVGLIRELKVAYSRMANLYLRDFFSTRYKTLILPMQQADTYDPYLTKFVKAIFETDLSPTVGLIQPLGVEHIATGTEYTVFDVIERMDEALLYSVARESGLVNVSFYRARPALRTIAYSGISQVVCMMDGPYSNDLQHVMVDSMGDIEKAGIRSTKFEKILPQLEPGQLEPRPDSPPFIKRVVVDTCYVFSEAFYTGEGHLSVMERMVRDMIARKPLDLKELNQLVSYSDQFNNLERFYYVPILMAMVKIAIGVVS